MNLKDTYNLIAEDWHQDHLNDDWWIAGTQKFADTLPEGATLLDVGCAGGTKTKYLVDRGFNVTGIDLSDNMIKIAQRELPSVEFHAMDMRNVRELNKIFDAVFMQASFLHIPKKDAASVLETMKDVLNAGGHLYIAVKETYPDGPDEEIKQESDYGYKYERFFSHYKQDELVELVRKVGFEIIYADNAPSGRTKWIQVFARKI